MKTVEIFGILYEQEDNGYDPTINEDVVKKITIFRRPKRESRVGLFKDKIFQQIPKNLVNILTEALREEFNDLIDIEITTQGYLKIIKELPFDLSWSLSINEVTKESNEVIALLKDWENKLKKGEKVNGRGGEVLEKYYPAICKMARKII